MDVKTEIQRLLEQEKDEDILKAVHTILKKNNREDKWREKLSSRAKEAEKDINEGRTHELEEVKKKTDRQLNP